MDLGVDWDDVETLSDLQTELITALDSLGAMLTSSQRGLMLTSSAYRVWVSGIGLVSNSSIRSLVRV